MQYLPKMPFHVTELYSAMYHQQQDYAVGWPKITDGRKYPKALYTFPNENLL